MEGWWIEPALYLTGILHGWWLRKRWQVRHAKGAVQRLEAYAQRAAPDKVEPKRADDMAGLDGKPLSTEATAALLRRMNRRHEA